VPLVAWAFYGCLAVDVALLFDPRYETERYLAANVAPYDVIEIYGSNVYQPRFPAGVHVVRVGLEPLETRNPLPGVTEVREPFDRIESRRPRWIVVSEAWVWRYFYDVQVIQSFGLTVAPGQEERLRDLASRDFFSRLYQGKGGYRLAHDSAWQSKYWPRVDIHASTTREVVVFERNDGS